ncbi:MAG TPA: GNAT family N-acetyltransferase [Acidobacteriaceae bacterium]|nr:GNAT family N-acetyltransferase [Acidobacteriaceae bacterium]
MTFDLRPLQSTDLDEIAAIATASPEAPQWPRSAYASYIAPDPANPALLRIGLAVTEVPNQARPDTQPLRDLTSEREARPQGLPVLLGFACATLLLDGTQNLCQLDSMAVHPSHRRHGIGAALLRELLAWATQNGAFHFSLEVRASNTAAIALYQRFGLRPEGRRTRYYAHPEEDALLLGIPITPGSPPPVFHYEIG